MPCHHLRTHACTSALPGGSLPSPSPQRIPAEQAEQSVSRARSRARRTAVAASCPGRSRTATPMARRQPVPTLPASSGAARGGDAWSRTPA